MSFSRPLFQKKCLVVNFRVESANDLQVRLGWETAVEIDNYGFNLYRAPANDRAQAELIHFEPSAIPGGRGTGTKYSYTDQVPASGVWWYWLADVDMRGAETSHAPVNTGLSLESTVLHLYLPVVRR
jgi:hypothetical protein